MRRHGSSRLTAVGCLIAMLQCALPCCGQGEVRILRFRELTETNSSTTDVQTAAHPAPIEPKTAAATPPHAAESSRTPLVNDSPPARDAQEAAPAPPTRAVRTPVAPRQPFQQLPRTGLSGPAQRTSPSEPPMTNQTRQALNFYGGQSARSTLSQLPRREIQPNGSAPVRPPVKPFEVVPREPTVSPYMHLYHDDLNTESAPNYFAFVRPQMDQIESNRLQQHELHKLRSQVQRLSSTVAGPQYQTGDMPATGARARFMDTAQFFNGLPR